MRIIVSVFVLLLGMNCSVHAQEWELLTPLKSGDVVSGISFLDGNKGYAVLQAAGEVIHTEDGGSTWNRPWTPGISSNLYDIEYVSEDTIFTCGSSGEIFRSIDAGLTWLEMTTPTNEFLYSLEFVNSNLGFASGFNGLILRTQDGGDHWGILETGTTNRLMDIEFWDSQLGYACGWNGAVIKTSDGGESWQALDSDFDGSLLDIALFSPSGVMACGWNNTIIRSIDSGQTFSTMNTGGFNSLHYIGFLNEQVGWAIGDSGIIFRTTNGGNSWSQSTVVNANLFSGDELPNGKAFIAGTGNIFSSTNEGNNWELLKNFVPKSKNNGLFFSDDQNGTVVGSVGITGEGSGQSGIVQTEDGGQTWQVRNQGFSGGWWDVHFADENNGIALGGINFAKTSNGGVNWTVTSLPSNLTGVGTWLLDSQTGLLGGEGIFNGICRFNDGGFSFDCNDTLLAKDFFFLDDQIGWAIHEGGSGNIAKTTDGGLSWEYIPTGNFSGFHSIFFLDEMTGWLGTGAGSVLRTTDGGENWELGFAGGDIVGIHFYNENLGFCVDWNNTLFRSDDGGATWNAIAFSTETMPPCQEGVFTDNYVYTGNWGGDIYRLELGCGDEVDGEIVTAENWCEGEVGMVSFETEDSVDQISWGMPDGWTYTGEGLDIEVTAGTESGVIQAMIVNSCGIESAFEVEVSLTNLPPNPMNYIIDGPTCAGSEFTIAIPDQEQIPGIEVEWFLPSDWELQLEDPWAIFVTAETTNDVLIVFTNSCGQSEEPLNALVEITPLPEVEWELTQDTACVNEIVTFQEGIPTGGSFSGTWTFNDTLFVPDYDPGVINIEYEVEVDGCIGSAEDVLEIIDTPTSPGLLEEYNLCLGDSLQINNLNISESNEVFTDDGLMSSLVDNELTLSTEEQGTYSLIVINVNECGTNSDVAEVNVVEPLASMNWDGLIYVEDSVICFDGNIGFQPLLEPSGGVLSGPGVLDNQVSLPDADIDMFNTFLYSVEAFEGCTAVDSFTVFISNCFSVNEINLDQLLNVFPNPNEGEFRISPDPMLIGKELQVIDWLGKLIHRERITSDGQEINLNRLATGTYLLRVEGQSGSMKVQILR